MAGKEKRDIRITISRHVGYCGGVKRTLNIVEELLKAPGGKTIFMLGEIVHNEFVLNNLKAQGVRIIHDFEQARGGLLVIQSHGIPESLYEEIKNSDIDFIDTTCPMVKNIHRKIKILEKDGYFPVIIGAANHSEVIGIAGQVKRSLIIKKPEEVTEEAFREIQRAGIVVQSTFIKDDALKIVEKIRKTVRDVRFEDTICRPTTDRQMDVLKNSGKYDCVFVFGSTTSANTKNLYSIAKKKNPDTFLISAPEDVEKIDLGGCSTFYVISGASTPLELIDRVVDEIKKVVQ